MKRTPATNHPRKHVAGLRWFSRSPDPLRLGSSTSPPHPRPAERYPVYLSRASPPPRICRCRLQLPHPLPFSTSHLRSTVASLPPPFSLCLSWPFSLLPSLSLVAVSLSPWFCFSTSSLLVSFCTAGVSCRQIPFRHRAVAMHGYSGAWQTHPQNPSLLVEYTLSPSGTTTLRGPRERVLDRLRKQREVTGAACNSVL